jgi:hypothetical protein
MASLQATFAEAAPYTQAHYTLDTESGAQTRAVVVSMLPDASSGGRRLSGRVSWCDPRTGRGNAHS